MKLPTDSSLSCARTKIVVLIRYLPASFIFLTKDGYPITKDDENQFTCSDICDERNLIKIQKNFEKPRIGVQDVKNNDFGFIFIDHTCGLSALRTAIQTELKVPENFRFKDSNNWLVIKEHEAKLVVLDVLQGAVVKITEVKKRPLPPPPPPPPPPIQAAGDDYKDILISYVRQEAAEFALLLKSALIRKFVTVYLDVHEIKPGIDWQDSLNNAVTHCQLFVPLITKNYGETQWTNREVKLADVLRKPILPVTFLTHWPPQPLAIQFASTQYVTYRPDLNIKGTADTQSVYSEVLSPNSQENANTIENTKWHPEHVEFVADEIGKFLRDSNNDNSKKLKTSLARQPSKLKSYPKTSKLPIDIGYQVRGNKEGNPLVVISLHPAKNSFGQKIAKLVEDVCVDVWLSTSCESLADEPTLPENVSPKLRNSEFFSPTPEASLKRSSIFQDKANEAGCIILLLSKEFIASNISKSHLYYCEHRKRLIPIICDDFEMPAWTNRLINSRLIIDARTKNFEETLKYNIRKALHTSARFCWADDVEEEKISTASNLIKKLMPTGFSVYVTGSKLINNEETRNICKLIGQHLAALENVHIVTGGFKGVGDVVARSAFDERNDVVDDEKHIWHILPRKDDYKYSDVADQNEDGTFEMVEYGNTVFSGDSVKEREIITSRVFDICILIGGGPELAKEIDHFVWSEKVVLPIRKTGGAADGKYDISPKIFDLPVAVSLEDWSVLLDDQASPERIGKAVAKITMDLKKQHAVEAPSQYATTPFETPVGMKKGFLFKQNTLEQS
ncbi:DgyrCDS5384 [Dimorphilus gyrociliatus]|nr:DgyrCDS5384 [Dimorphilus gyrociliatus]